MLNFELSALLWTSRIVLFDTRECFPFIKADGNWYVP